MLKGGVGLGKALSGPCDLPRAMGRTGHPTVLIQAGKCTASHSNPGCSAQLDGPVSTISWPSATL